MKRHPFRLDALVFGVAFLAAAGLWSLWTLGLFRGDQLAYLAAASMIGVGVLGIVGSIVAQTRKENVDESETDPLA